MAVHRFREQIESISPVSVPEGFVPCPGALMQMLAPGQQSAAQQIYQLARAGISQPEPAPCVRVDFSLN